MFQRRPHSLMMFKKNLQNFQAHLVIRQSLRKSQNQKMRMLLNMLIEKPLLIKFQAIKRKSMSLEQVPMEKFRLKLIKKN